jgi:hypothetical protein
MHIDGQPFPINTLELANEKVFVRSDVANKDKGKSVVIGHPHTSNPSLGVATRKAPIEKRTVRISNKTESTRGQDEVRHR